MSYRPSTYSALAGWQGSSPETQEQPQPEAGPSNWIPPTNWQPYYPRSEPTTQLSIPTQYPAPPQLPLAATSDTPTQTPIPRPPIFRTPPTPIARPRNPALPQSPMLPLPDLDQAWTATWVGTENATLLTQDLNWSPDPRTPNTLGQIDSSRVTSPYPIAGPSTIPQPLFSPAAPLPRNLQPPPPSSPPATRRKVGRPKIERLPCCGKKITSQHGRHQRSHCPNRKEKPEEVLICPHCERGFTAMRKDNFRRHEKSCGRKKENQKQHEENN